MWLIDCAMSLVIIIYNLECPFGTISDKIWNAKSHLRSLWFYRRCFYIWWSPLVPKDTCFTMKQTCGGKKCQLVWTIQVPMLVMNIVRSTAVNGARNGRRFRRIKTAPAAWVLSGGELLQPVPDLPLDSFRWACLFHVRIVGGVCVRWTLLFWRMQTMCC